jgi:hypothetical protein
MADNFSAALGEWFLCCCLLLSAFVCLFFLHQFQSPEVVQVEDAEGVLLAVGDDE